MSRSRTAWVWLLASLSCFPSFGADEYVLHVPQGLEQARLRIPRDNPMTAAKVTLGHQLFFEKRLSRDNTVSCASCHDPQQGWSNAARFATGVRDQQGGRSAPTIINAGYLSGGSVRFAKLLQFWDGRSVDLEGQALGPIANPIEMDLTIPEAVDRLNSIEGYRAQFQEVFGTDATEDALAKSIAAFERTVLSGNAPIDRYLAGEEDALSDSARRGWALFNAGNRANCTACHKYPNFADGGFHNLGVGIGAAQPDLGRFVVTDQEGDRGRFKTPTLREIARTAPYMHDGSQATLEDVVEYYVKGGVQNPQLDEEMKPLKLTDEEKADLVSFLREGLGSSDYPEIAPPDLPD